MTLECIADSFLGDIPNLKQHQRSSVIEHPTRNDDGDNDREDERSGTYSDRLVLGPSGKKLAVWTKAHASNIQIVGVICRFIDQDAVQRRQSVLGVPPTNLR
jgi:hypothetical protein